jgi:hypothetical protein
MPWGLIALTLMAATACKSGGSADGDGGGSTLPGAIQGVVREIGTGTPVVGAVVSDGTSSATTDAAGRYTLSDKPVGPYSLDVAAAGYAPSSRVAQVASAATTTMDWHLTAAPGQYLDLTDPSHVATPAEAMDYVILAWNDLGMHCAQDDYSYFLILPPYNTLHVQVIHRGFGLVTSGITVSYAFPTKTDPKLHTNFWTYASAYGFSLAPNEGLTGNFTSGTMALDANGIGFVATGIPITPYDDDGTWNPYGKALISVRDGGGTLLQTAEVVAPVSTELNCFNCHGANAFLDILQTHDRRSGTHLAADQAVGTLHLCAECHADNVLALPGTPGVKNLSHAMHGFHADKVFASAGSGPTACYNCHPGPATRCLRGGMFHAGQSCQDCHGDMAGMAAGLAAGRAPWLQEPRCADCHGARYGENPGTLYRNSVLENSPIMVPGPSLMDGKLYCEGCHNSTHAELRSTLPADASIPQKFQGDDYWL